MCNKWNKLCWFIVRFVLLFSVKVYFRKNMPQNWMTEQKKSIIAQAMASIYNFNLHCCTSFKQIKNSTNLLYQCFFGKCDYAYHRSIAVCSLMLSSILSVYKIKPLCRIEICIEHSHYFFMRQQKNTPKIWMTRNRELRKSVILI